MRWLFLFVPAAFIAGEIPNIPPALLFFISALAIIPIAHLIAESTEQIAYYTGEAVGGLLNATFGNFPELIISIVALHAGKLDLVAASIIGAILANLLLAQGLSFFIGGIKFKEQEYNSNSIRLYSTMMLVSVVSLAIPSTFALGANDHARISAGTELNLSISVLLLIMYVLYLVFTLVTHPHVLAAKQQSNNQSEAGQHANWSLKRAALTLVAASVVAALLSEILVGSAEGAGHQLGMSQAFIGLVCVAVVGGAAESLSAITMGSRNRMDLSIGISLGSSIQIALFIAPLLVLIGHFILGQAFQLVFNTKLLVFLFLSVILSTVVSGDGRSNWYKGIQLIILYIMLAVTLYLTPN